MIISTSPLQIDNHHLIHSTDQFNMVEL